MIAYPLFAFSQQDVVVRLRESIRAEKDDTVKARLLGKLAWELKFQDLHEAVLLAEQEIAIAYKYANHTLLADGYRVKALALVINEQIVDGMISYDSALVHARLASNPYYEASCYSLMAGMYGDHADYDKAIELYLKGLDVAIQTKDAKLIAMLSNNLAESYQSDGRDTKITQRYFIMALENSIRIQDWPMAGMCSANLAQEYTNIGKKSMAIAETKRAIELMNMNPADAYRWATTSHVLASVFFDSGNIADAEKYALASAHIMDSLKMPDNILRPLSILTKVYIAKNNLKTAESYSTQLLELAKAQNAKLYIRDAYKALSDIALIKQKYEDALLLHKQYKFWNDSVFEINREKVISNIEAKAKLAQNELEIKYDLKNKQQENENLRLLNKALNTERILAIIICMIFMALVFVLYFFNRKTRRINSELHEERRLVEKQAKEKEMLVHEIHHRVKNNLTTLKSLLYLQAKNANHDEIKRILLECQARIQSMALVHQHLYDDNESGNLDFVSFLDLMFGELNNSFYKTDSDITFEVQGSCDELNISKAIPLGLIMNELVTNSIKYAFNDKEVGKIEILLSQKENELVIVYSDSGPGLDVPFNLQQGGFGFKVLNILCQQLSASMDYQLVAEKPVFTIKMLL